jgi:hypothetical protein
MTAEVFDELGRVSHVGRSHDILRVLAFQSGTGGKDFHSGPSLILRLCQQSEETPLRLPALAAYRIACWHHSLIFKGSVYTLPAAADGQRYSSTCSAYGQHLYPTGHAHSLTCQSSQG